MRSKTAFEHLSEYIRSELKDMGVPGLAIGICHNGECSTAGFGVTHIKHALPVDDQTRFQIGSITKTITGTAVMRLVEKGKLDLDATVRTYVPDFKVADKTASEQVTLRHLLTHTAGWDGDFFHDTGPGEDALSRYVADMTDLQQMAPLGAVFTYNNAGFVLLGHILETVEKRPSESLLKSLVLNPLHMTSAAFLPGDVMTHRFAVGHGTGKKGPKVAHPWPLPRYAWAAGGVVCHVKDLLKYARFHLGDGTASGKRLLKAKTLKQMHTRQASIGRLQDAIGLTWFIDRIKGCTLISHGGATVGQNAHLMFAPEHDFALALLTNSGQGSRLIQKVKRRACRDYLDIDIPEPHPIKATPQDLKPYAGRYVRPGSEIRLKLKKGALCAQTFYSSGFPSEKEKPPPPSPQIPCTLSGKDRLIATDGPTKGTQVEFVRTPGGDIGWIRAGLRIFKRK